jgi:excisionase family DNA binding protein
MIRDFTRRPRPIEQRAQVDDLLSLRQAADQLGVTAATLRELIHAGDGPTAVCIGRRWLKIRKSDLDAFLRARTVRPRESVEAQAAA